MRSLADGFSRARRYDACARPAHDFEMWQRTSRTNDASKLGLHNGTVAWGGQQALILWPGGVEVALEDDVEPRSGARLAIYIFNQKAGSTWMADEFARASTGNESRRALRTISRFRQTPKPINGTRLSWLRLPWIHSGRYLRTKGPMECSSASKPPPAVFTIVREPTAAFLSGLTEIACRSDGFRTAMHPPLIDGGSLHALLRASATQPVGAATALVEQAIAGLEAGNRHVGDEAVHIWPQAHRIDAVPESCNHYDATASSASSERRTGTRGSSGSTRGCTCHLTRRDLREPRSSEGSSQAARPDMSYTFL